MYVTPPNFENVTLGMLFVIYDSAEGGHYDAAIPYNLTESTLYAQTKHLSCNCGVNSGDDGIKSCVPLPFSNTRCKCFKNSQPCSMFCRCKNCENPAGKRSQYKQSKRKMVKHSSQLDIPSSKRFAIDKGEVISTAIWSEFETIVIQEVMKYLEDESKDEEELTKMYNDVVYYASSLFCTLHLPDDAVFRKSLRFK